MLPNNKNNSFEEKHLWIISALKFPLTGHGFSLARLLARATQRATRSHYSDWVCLLAALGVRSLNGKITRDFLKTAVPHVEWTCASSFNTVPVFCVISLRRRAANPMFPYFINWPVIAHVLIIMEGKKCASIERLIKHGKHEWINPVRE